MIIVTGSKGFIGQNFLKALKDKEIKEVEKNDSGHFRQSFKDWNKVELILHQGAISHTTSTNLKALQHFNVEFSQWILQQAIKYQIPIKYASSASVYGHTLTDMNPLNYYAISKLTVDYWIQDHINEFSFIQAFRYFNVYGEGEENKGDQASPISKFTKQVKEDGKIKLFEGSDKFLRDFIFVDDVVDIVHNNDKPSGFYDLGTSNPTSFQEVGELVAEKYSGIIKYIPFPEHLKGKYQTYTCAKKEWDYKFTTVKEYLQR